ncbi:MAG: hypothetical protein M1830_009547 [Pleopsidium flavum]|nr:MAG: hypothetical protein M1830_009547 [Pleopsidium flavum]
MCIVDRINHPKCGHTTYHLLMACCRPKTPHRQSEFEYCTEATYRNPYPSSEYSCIVCKRGPSAETVKPVAGKENVKAVPKKENVKPVAGKQNAGI